MSNEVKTTLPFILVSDSAVADILKLRQCLHL